MEERYNQDQEISTETEHQHENFKYPNFVKFTELTKQLSETISPLKKELISKKLRKLRKKVFAEVAASEFLRQISTQTRH